MGSDGATREPGTPSTGDAHSTSHLFQPAWGTRTYIMGVLNVTPDSFSGDGLAGLPAAQAAARAASMEGDGADIVDLGGESTRPGHTPVGEEDEMTRVLPALRAARALGVGPLSVDTRKAEVAEAGVAAGAMMINDVSGLADEHMAQVAAGSGVWLVLVHNRLPDPTTDVLSWVLSGLEEIAARAIAAGVSADRIIVDPGLGFRKNWRHNFEILRRLRELRSLGCPVLVGPSRKGMIGRVLGTPPEDRMEGTAALCVIAIANGADMLRVHDVRQMVRVARMTDALARQL